MTSRFLQKYNFAVERNTSLLCVGLDPDEAQMPAGVEVVDFLRDVVEATADLVCAYKPNAAFFESRGAQGWAELKAVIHAIPDDVPVLLDAKRGDVTNTNTFYARAVFETLGADGVTVSPYLGSDSMEPFFAYEDRHSFVLCHTSNPGAGDLQDLRVGGGQPLYEHVASLATGWNGRGNVGLLVGATYPEHAARIRAICPELLFLMPGIGAQEGDLGAAVRSSLRADGSGILVSASRTILYAGTTKAARGEAIRLRTAINAARGA